MVADDGACVLVKDTANVDLDDSDTKENQANEGVHNVECPGFEIFVGFEEAPEDGQDRNDNEEEHEKESTENYLERAEEDEETEQSPELHEWTWLLRLEEVGEFLVREVG